VLSVFYRLSVISEKGLECTEVYYQLYITIYLEIDKNTSVGMF
jgi:hypothetical protein